MRQEYPSFVINSHNEVSNLIDDGVTLQTMSTPTNNAIYGQFASTENNSPYTRMRIILLMLFSSIMSLNALYPMYFL